MIKKTILIFFLFVNIGIIGCGSGITGTDENGTDVQVASGSAPALTEATVHDDDLSLHVPPAVWIIGNDMRFEITYSDDDADADTLELMVYDWIGNVYSGPYYFELDPEAGWFYTNQDQAVEGAPGFYELEFKVVDSQGHESDPIKIQIRFK